jgi:hypothetical protein
MSAKNNVKIVIITSDSDFIHIIKEAKERECDVTLICRQFNSKEDLLAIVDHIIEYNDILDEVRNRFRYANQFKNCRRFHYNETNRLNSIKKRENTYQTWRNSSHNTYRSKKWCETGNDSILVSNSDAITDQPNVCQSSAAFTSIESDVPFAASRHTIVNVIDDDQQSKCDTCLDICCRVCNMFKRSKRSITICTAVNFICS